MSIKDYLKTTDNIMEVEEGEVDNYLSELQELFFEFVNSYVDMDYLNEEQIDILDEILEMTESDDNKDEFIEDEVNEAMGKRKKVVRGGKKKKKLSCPKGYKAQSGRCVKQSAQEKRTRSRAQKKAAKKRRSSQKSTTMKRQRSMRRR